MEDREIVGLYWERSENAISETAAKYGRYCRRIAENILKSAEDVEESLNDTWMGAWNSIPPHRPEVLSSYLGKITRNICLKKWRYLHARKRGGDNISLIFDELSESIPDRKDIDSELEAKELTKILDSFISALPDTERRVFVRRYWYLDSVPDIAKQFGFSRSKVKTMLWRTRQKLTIRLEKEGVFYEG